MNTVAAFAALLREQQRDKHVRSWPGALRCDVTVNVHPGRVYTKLDICVHASCSGKYMVEDATGIIYGIKAYGKVHKGHVYGTLDTTDDWDWSGYRGIRL